MPRSRLVRLSWQHQYPVHQYEALTLCVQAPGGWAESIDRPEADRTSDLQLTAVAMCALVEFMCVRRGRGGPVDGMILAVRETFREEVRELWGVSGAWTQWTQTRSRVISAMGIDRTDARPSQAPVLSVSIVHCW